MITYNTKYLLEVSEMELRTCEFCGTEYDETLNRCPLCGKSPHQSAGQSEGIVEKPAKLEGRNMVMFMAAKPAK